MVLSEKYCYTLEELAARWSCSENDIINLAASKKLWLSVNLDHHANSQPTILGKEVSIPLPPPPLSGWWHLLLPLQISGFLPDKETAFFSHFQDPVTNRLGYAKTPPGTVPEPYGGPDGSVFASFEISRSELVVMAEEVTRYEAENPVPSSKVRKPAEHDNAGHQNCFIRRGDYWEIIFQGLALTLVKHSVTIQAIAKRLQEPGVPWKSKISGVRDGRKVGSEEKAALESLHDDLKERVNTAETRESREDLEEKLTKAKRAIEELGGNVSAQGKIHWNRTSAKDDTEWNTHAKQIRNGINKIEDNEHGKELADFLKKHLLPHKYYLPPTDSDIQWKISL